MKGLQSFVIAHFKYAVRVPWGAVTSFSVSVGYSVVMTLQIFFTYKITQTPFPDLPFELFLLCFFMNQVIFFIGLACGVGNIGRFCRTLINGGIDMMLLRPVPMAFYMFAQRIRVDHITMLCIYVILFLYQSIAIGLDLPRILMLSLYCFISGILYFLLVVFYNGIGCLLRNVDNIRRVATSADELLQNRPPEIFPRPVQFFFTFVFPMMFAGSYIFDLVRNRESLFIWVVLIFWLVVISFLNWGLWHHIFKNYESIG